MKSGTVRENSPRSARNSLTSTKGSVSSSSSSSSSFAKSPNGEDKEEIEGEGVRVKAYYLKLIISCNGNKLFVSKGVYRLLVVRMGVVVYSYWAC